MSEFASHSTDYSVVEQEPPEIMARNLRVGAHIWSSATAFFFIAFLFAYFYLRSLNTHGDWKPKGVDAPVGWGTAIMICTVLCFALVAWGSVDQRSDRRPLFRIKAAIGLALGLAAVILQAIVWTSQLSWGPTDGGFASVYLGWTGLLTLFLFGTLYWLETILAVSYRYRGFAMGRARVEPGHAAGDADRETSDIANPVSLNTSELVALTSHGAVLTGIAVVTWIVLYLL